MKPGGKEVNLRQLVMSQAYIYRKDNARMALENYKVQDVKRISYKSCDIKLVLCEDILLT